MALRSPSILIIGHSVVCRLSDFSPTQRIRNVGLPAHFTANANALQGACLQDLTCSLDDIVHMSPRMIIFDFGSFDLLVTGISCV